MLFITVASFTPSLQILPRQHPAIFSHSSASHLEISKYLPITLLQHVPSIRKKNVLTRAGAKMMPATECTNKF